MGTFMRSFLLFGPVVQEEMSFKDFLFLALVAILIGGAEQFEPLW